MTTTITHYFPVAGCAPATHRQAAEYHHRWLVVDEKGQWLSARDCAALAHVTADMKMGYLVLRAPGMLRMDIPLDVIEDDESVCRTAIIAGLEVRVVDEGDVAAVWISHVTGGVSRIVKVHPEAESFLWPEAT